MKLTPVKNFNIEKPLPLTIESDLVSSLQESGNYIGQPKLDEHRSFICFNDDKIEVLGWRGNVHRIIPNTTSYNNLVLDGGLLITNKFRKEPFIYLFDVILVGGNKVNADYEKRYEFLSNLKLSGNNVVAPNIKDFKEEYHRIKNKESKYITELANKFGLKSSEIYDITEGLVLKNKSWKLRYKQNMNKNSDQIKIKF